MLSVTVDVKTSRRTWLGLLVLPMSGRRVFRKGIPEKVSANLRYEE